MVNMRSVYTLLKTSPRSYIPSPAVREFKAFQSYGKTQDISDETTSSTIERLRRELEADKQALQWRKPIGERPGDWHSKLKAFESAEQNADFILAMQRPIDLSPASIKAWWMKRQEETERATQAFVPERLQILGPDLAAAHFILYRGGAVRFTRSPQWIRANEHGEFDLPRTYEPDYMVEGLRCDNMQLYYEGLENIRCLSELKFLSFHNVQTFDDFCLDRVSGAEYSKLEVLDISGTKCTANGYTCLYRIPTLKLLIVDNPSQNLWYQLTCAMLEEVIPNIKIVPAATIHNISTAEPPQRELSTPSSSAKATKSKGNVSRMDDVD